MPLIQMHQIQVSMRLCYLITIRTLQYELYRKQRKKSNKLRNFVRLHIFAKKYDRFSIIMHKKNRLKKQEK